MVSALARTHLAAHYADTQPLEEMEWQLCSGEPQRREKGWNPQKG